MKHLVTVIPGLDRLGGAERQALLLARGLRGRGWRVSVVVLSGPGAAAAADLAEMEISLHSLGMRKGIADPRGWLRFGRWLARERPDIVHAHLPHAAWMARGARLYAPVPIQIDTLHSSSTGGRGRWIGYRLSRRFPDCVTAVSHAAAEAHLRAGMVRAERLTVLPNGVDTAVWRPDTSARWEVRRELGINDEFVFFAAGRLEPVKDYPTLLRALAGVRDACRLLIAGGGSQREALSRLAERLGLADRVRFLGFQPDLRRWMRAADAVVLASRWEGLPMNLLEAGACALPCIATDVPGTREVLVDGETGWLVPAGDLAALTAAMSRMCGLAPAERQAMGDCARRFVRERFGLEAVLDRWEALYEELLTGTRPPGCASGCAPAPAAGEPAPGRHRVSPRRPEGKSDSPREPAAAK